VTLRFAFCVGSGGYSIVIFIFLLLVNFCHVFLCYLKFKLFVNLICIAGWTIERGIKQGSQCRIEIVFGSGAWAGNICVYGSCIPL